MMSGRGVTSDFAATFDNEIAPRCESRGEWAGRGAHAADFSGDVLPGQLAALFNQVHPVSGVPLGRAYAIGGSSTNRRGRVGKRRKQAAFAAVFSVPKSVSELFAQLDPRRQGLVIDAASAANQAALNHLDNHAAFSRIGGRGVRHVDTEGLVVATYLAVASRCDDPHLHFHNLVSNRDRCVEDRVWRALDGRHLRAEMKAAGMVGQAVLRAELVRTVGVTFTPTTKHGFAEIVGVPTALLEFHSTRSNQVDNYMAARSDLARSEQTARASNTAVARVVAARATSPQRQLTPTDRVALARRWRQDAVDAGFDPTVWLPTTTSTTTRLAVPVADATLVDEAVALMTGSKTFGRTHVIREFARITPHRGASGSEVAARIEALTARLLTDERVVEVETTPPNSDTTRMRADGVSQYQRHNTARYTIEPPP